MIMSQEQAIFKAKKQFEQIELIVRQAAFEGQRIDLFERELWDQMLQLGHNLLQAFVESQGNGDVGETIEMTDGETLRRLDEPHRRSYRSIFGSFTLSRYVYGTSSARPNRIQVRSQIDIAAIHFLSAVIASEARNVIWPNCTGGRDIGRQGRIRSQHRRTKPVYW